MSHLSPAMWKQKASHCASCLFAGAGLDAYCEQISLINYKRQSLTRANARGWAKARGWNSSWLERKWPLIQCFPAAWSQPRVTLSSRNCVKSLWQLHLHHPAGLLSSSRFLGISHSLWCWQRKWELISSAWVGFCGWSVQWSSVEFVSDCSVLIT